MTILGVTLFQAHNIGGINCTGAFCPGAGGANAGTEIENLMSTLFGFLTIVAGLAFLIYFVTGAIKWITAGGDAGKVDDAKRSMTNGAIGMIAVVAAYGIIAIVGAVLGINIFQPATIIDTLPIN